MPAAVTYSPNRPPWPAVLLCCLLSVSAPLAESTIVPLFDPTAAPVTGLCIAEQDDQIEDEDDLYSARGVNASLRLERRQAGPLLFISDAIPADPRLTPFSARRAAADRVGAGCEHASRNGHG